jgi:hypothetical protein
MVINKQGRLEIVAFKNHTCTGGMDRRKEIIRLPCCCHRDLFFNAAIRAERVETTLRSGSVFSLEGPRAVANCPFCATLR